MGEDTGASHPWHPGGDFFFVVANNPQESRLDRLAPADLQAAQKHVAITPALTTQELTAFLHGGTPGMEIWEGLIVGAILALVLEVALSRWIARRRGAHAAVPVAFGKEPLDVQSFRQRAQEMLAVPQVGTGSGEPGTGNRTETRRGERGDAEKEEENVQHGNAPG